jgi:hypothetical protein
MAVPSGNALHPTAAKALPPFLTERENYQSRRTQRVRSDEGMSALSWPRMLSAQDCRLLGGVHVEFLSDDVIIRQLAVPHRQLSGAEYEIARAMRRSA